MKIRPIDRIFSILSGVLTPFFLVACAAIVPCAFRPFYYACIRPLQIPETSGYSVETIREAFDDVMDFLWCGAEFKTGSLAWTESEKAHFADCIPAFHLQAILLIAGGIFLIVYLILLRRGVLRRARLFGVPSVSYGAAGLLLFLAAVGGYAALDFGGLFNLFHKIVFPGKENWHFNPNTEQVINILPQEFFLVCAVYIISVAVLLAILAVVLGFVARKKARREGAAGENR